MFTIIKNNYHHIIYGIIIIALAGGVYHFFKKEPEKIIQTVTKVVTQVKTVDKDRIVYVDRTITTTKPDGEKIVEVDHEHSNTDTKADIKSITDTHSVSQSTTVTSFQKNYSIETLFQIDPLNPTKMPDPRNNLFEFGYRLFGSDLWGVVGTTGRLDKLYLGLRYDF